MVNLSMQMHGCCAYGQHLQACKDTRLMCPLLHPEPSRACSVRDAVALVLCAAIYDRQLRNVHMQHDKPSCWVVAMHSACLGEPWTARAVQCSLSRAILATWHAACLDFVQAYGESMHRNGENRQQASSNPSSQRLDHHPLQACMHFTSLPHSHSRAASGASFVRSFVRVVCEIPRCLSSG